jgi:nucleoside-diphosphate-sugar epimerase
VVNVLAAKAVIDGEITIDGGGQWRPFVHVSDVARLLADCLKKPRAQIGGQIFNLGSDAQNHTISEVGEMVLQCTPAAKLTIREGDRDRDLRNYRVSFTKIERDLGFRPRKCVLDGIREIQQAVAEGSVIDYRAPKYHNVAMIRQNGNGEGTVRRARYGYGPKVVDAETAKPGVMQNHVA